MGFEAPTPIQEQVIPLAIEGRDIIGQAQTGTGKTAAFGIPMIEQINNSKDGINGLVLAPTRELAIQVAEELNSIGEVKGVYSLPIYGGQEISRQIKSLKVNKPQIIVGTPGRLMDHMRRRTIVLENITTTILDEADEMLNMGFIEDIETILQDVPTDRQTMLFSATMPQPVQDLATRFMENPEIIKIKPQDVTVPSTEQYYLEVKEKQKLDVLCRMLDLQSPEAAIVFGRTKKRVDELYEALNKRGFFAEGIHGDLTQSRRDSVMQNFRKGASEILVATDVASRGLDIGNITHIYNFDIPQDPGSYVHRIGRTGRLGKAGLAITFVTPRELDHLRFIEKTIQRKIFKQHVPTVNEALESQQQAAAERVIRAVEEDIHPYKKYAEKLLQQQDSVSLLAAALKILTKEPTYTSFELTDQAPLTKDKKKPPERRTSWKHKNKKNTDKYQKRKNRKRRT